MSTHHIYTLTNSVNGKMYVGQTCDPAARKQKHFSSSSACSGIAGAIHKHGAGRFVFTVIKSGISEDEIDALEIATIAELGTLAPSGYNLTPGGERYEFTEDHRRKISEANTGRPLAIGHNVTAS